MKNLFVLMLMLLSIANLSGQVGIGTASPAGSAVLELSSTTKGMLMPRMTTAQRNAIVSPISGLMILNLDDKCIDIYDGTNWIKNCGLATTGTDTMPNDTWTLKQNFGGTGRVGAAGFSINGKGYIGTGSNGNILSDFWEYNPATNTWTQKANVPASIVYGVGMAIYYFAELRGYLGGGTWFGEYNSINNTWTQKASIPGGTRQRAVAFTDLNLGYVGTGITAPNGVWYKDFYYYSPAVNSWSAIPDFPHNTYGAVAFIANGSAYVGTGWHEGILPLIPHFKVNTFYKYIGGGWVQVPSIPAAVRDNAIAFSIGNSGFVGTGADANGVLKKDMWEFDGTEWKQTTDFPSTARQEAIAFTIGTKGYVGTGSDGTYKQDFWEFDPYPLGNVYVAPAPPAPVYSVNDGVWTRSGTDLYTTNPDLVRITGQIKSPLRFENTLLNRKLVLYEAANNDHQYFGLGINGSILRYQVSVSGDNHVFYAGAGPASSVELMRIQGNGNIGIGISNAVNRLDIANGTSRSGTHPTGRPLYITGDFLAASNGVEFRLPNNTQGIGFGFNTMYAAGTDPDHDIGLAAKGTNGVVKFSTNGTERVRITGSGNVGIGTLSPNGQLQLSNAVQNRKVVLYEGVNNDHQYFGFGVNSGLLRYQATGDHVFYYGANSTTSNELFRITYTGNVGVGNAAPNAPLQFSNALQNRKIVLYEGNNNDHEYYGIGVNGSIFRYQVSNIADNHVFYAGASSSTSNELMRIQGNGDVTIAGTLVSEAFSFPELFNGFSNYGGGYASAAYFKDEMGIVHLRGLVNRATDPDGIVITQLPAGYRPSSSGTLIFSPLNSNVPCRLDILPDGNILVVFGIAGWISLDGITFRAD